MGYSSAQSTPCSWPDYFDLPRNGLLSLDGSKLWQTDTKVKIPKHGGQINGYGKSRTLIYVESNSTIRRTEQHGNKASIEFYKCVKAFNKTLFLIATFDKWDPNFNTTYRCIQFDPKNKFVLFWRWGDKHSEEIDCEIETGEFSRWPLIYWPLRKNSDRYQVFKFRESMSEYPSCPRLGGFLMRVFDMHGSEIKNCPNDYPSPRFDMECTIGEGLQLTPTDPQCRNYDFSGDPGAKMFCIANWIEDRFMFSILVPAHSISVNSFQCLRLNKDDPTSEPAVIFLDSVCKTTQPNNQTDSFLTLELRRKNVENICDDTSDQCDTSVIDCTKLKHWSTCMKTCKRCPVTGKVVLPTSKQIRGRWILQKYANKSIIHIDQYNFIFPGLGTFHAYSNKPDKSCIRYTTIFKNSSPYVLAQMPGNGCSPRVMQFNMKRISKSVAILHISGTSVIRNNDYTSAPGKWCWNNAIEAKSLYKVFQPYWPYTADSLSSFDTGWFTLVKNGPDVPDKCDIWNYFAHIKMQVEFNWPHIKHYKCDGEAHQSADDTWSMSYNACTNGQPPHKMEFTCLSHYELSGDYYAATLSVAEPLPGGGPDNTYFCLLWPTWKYRNKYPMMLHIAGECDFQFVFESIVGTRQPYAKIHRLETLNVNSAAKSSFSICLFVFMLFIAQFLTL